MPPSIRHYLVAVLAALPFLLIGLDWGLPSRASDRFLFGDRVPWTGAEIVELAGTWTPGDQGSDLQLDSPLDRSEPVVLNATDAQRADIVRRYRLYTAQPDEMINLRALAQMRPGQGQFDPRLYQYGGLWFYPAGVALQSAAWTGYVTLTPDLTYYLDRPEEVGRIYVVLRAVTAFWAILGVVAVVLMARQMGCPPLVAALAGVALASSPGVVVFGHEAKPHIPGLSLVLWSAALGTIYIRTGRRRWLVACSAAAGGALGMILSMLPAVLVPLVAVGLRGHREGNRLRWTHVVLAVGTFGLTYAVTNPYVVHHLLFSRELLTRQLGNSAAMYPVTSPLATMGTVFALLIALTPAVLLVLVALGAVLGDVKQLRDPRRTTPVYLPVPLLLLAGPAVVQLLVFAALASGKPGEYARFGLLVAGLGIVAAGYLATRFRFAPGIPGVVILLHLVLSIPELARFHGAPPTAGPVTTLSPAEVTLTHEPAPYNTPPMNLWTTRLILLPSDSAGRPVGEPMLRQPPRSDGFWRLSWADRSIEWTPIAAP